jgi:hypothetical protein
LIGKWPKKGHFFFIFLKFWEIDHIFKKEAGGWSTKLKSEPEKVDKINPAAFTAGLSLKTAL